MKKSRRQVRRNLIRLMEERLDFDRLDYSKRSYTINAKAKLAGILVALLLYSIGFAMGFFGWQSGSVSEDSFGKLVWVLMIPASVVGSFCWLLTKNRWEYPLRQQLRTYIQSIEKDRGFAWHFTPIYRQLSSTDQRGQELLSQSRAGDYARIIPEDYSKVLVSCYQSLRENSPAKLPVEILERVEISLESID